MAGMSRTRFDPLPKLVIDDAESRFCGLITGSWSS
jgi:hypothetical protein